MERIDIRLYKDGKAPSRAKAQELIANGVVSVNGKKVTKPSFTVEDADIISLSDSDVCLYVGRGGLKLRHALEAFKLDVTGFVCADIGASTGGFTDCLLQHGAARVYAVDSGSNQLAEKLKNDSRVISMENMNARYLTPDIFGEPIDIAVMDVSFISQTLLHPSLFTILRHGAALVTLIKPQFELSRGDLDKRGIVKSDSLRTKAVSRVVDSAIAFGFTHIGTVDSPIAGGDGNREYLAYFLKT